MPSSLADGRVWLSDGGNRAWPKGGRGFPADRSLTSRMTEAWDKTLVKRVERECRLKSEEKQAWRTPKTQRLTADGWCKRIMPPNTLMIQRREKGHQNWIEQERKGRIDEARKTHRLENMDKTEKRIQNIHVKLTHFNLAVKSLNLHKQDNYAIIKRYKIYERSVYKWM